MDLVKAVRAAAQKLALEVDDQGKFSKELDSLDMIDLVTELERVTKKVIPTASLRASTFESVHSVAQVLAEL